MCYSSLIIRINWVYYEYNLSTLHRGSLGCVYLQVPFEEYQPETYSETMSQVDGRIENQEDIDILAVWVIRQHKGCVMYASKRVLFKMR